MAFGKEVLSEVIGLGYQGREGGCICGLSLRDIPRMRFGVAPGTESERQAVLEQYNWEKESEKLLVLYERLIGKVR